MYINCISWDHLTQTIFTEFTGSHGACSPLSQTYFHPNVGTDVVSSMYLLPKGLSAYISKCCCGAFYLEGDSAFDRVQKILVHICITQLGLLHCDEQIVYIILIHMCRFYTALSDSLIYWFTQHVQLKRPHYLSLSAVVDVINDARKLVSLILLNIFIWRIRLCSKSKCLVLFTLCINQYIINYVNRFRLPHFDQLYSILYNLYNYSCYKYDIMHRVYTPVCG